MVKTVCAAVAVNACLRIILGSNVPEVESDSIQICPITGLDGALSEYEDPLTSNVFKATGEYVAPAEEYGICPVVGEVVVPVPPYWVGSKECESKVLLVERITPDALLSPLTMSLFLTLKSLSDNLDHISPNWLY